MADTSSIALRVPRGVDSVRAFGAGDAVLRALERELEARLVVRGDRVLVDGPTASVELAARCLETLFDRVAQGDALDAAYVAKLVSARRGDAPGSGPHDGRILTYRGRSIRPKTSGQEAYVEAMRSHTLSFCFGPAGTGKTYLAMALAVAALHRRECGRIVLTRPVVEAGESLGFLPGTLEEKVDPYVRPLLDALYDMMDAVDIARALDEGTIEIAPLAYMRGRTLNDAFVVLDEAQNTTPEQMKMFLTRLGFNARFVVTGDLTQRDLVGRRGGLYDIETILSGVDDIAFVHLDRSDVVRHELVGRIVEAYERYDERCGRADAARVARKEHGDGNAHR